MKIFFRKTVAMPGHDIIANGKRIGSLDRSEDTHGNIETGIFKGWMFGPRYMGKTLEDAKIATKSLLNYLEREGKSYG